MLSPESYRTLQDEISNRMALGKKLLEDLRKDVAKLCGAVRRIQPRNTTAISLVATLLKKKGLVL